MTGIISKVTILVNVSLRKQTLSPHFNYIIKHLQKNQMFFIVPLARVPQTKSLCYETPKTPNSLNFRPLLARGPNLAFPTSMASAGEVS